MNFPSSPHIFAWTNSWSGYELSDPGEITSPNLREEKARKILSESHVKTIFIRRITYLEITIFSQAGGRLDSKRESANSLLFHTFLTLPRCRKKLDSQEHKDESRPMLVGHSSSSRDPAPVGIIIYSRKSPP